ncbi:MAG: nucleoside triphosphate pyrophosphatase [Microcoleaceae cyanobacterium]
MVLQSPQAGSTESAKTLVLASASPARKRLLNMAGIQPLICPSHFDESQVQTTDPSQLVKTLAHCKAETVVRGITDNTLDISIAPRSALVLGCDSVLAVNHEIYGKPANKLEAFQRWQAVRGQVGELLTGHALVDIANNRTVVYSQMTQVYFAVISDQQIQQYVATGEPLKCAGGFAIEGKGGLFIEKIIGCHTNVIGLSLPLLRKMLEELGYDATQFWSTTRSD